MFDKFCVRDHSFVEFDVGIFFFCMCKGAAECIGILEWNLSGVKNKIFARRHDRFELWWNCVFDHAEVLDINSVWFFPNPGMPVREMPLAITK